MKQIGFGDQGADTIQQGIYVRIYGMNRLYLKRKTKAQ
jgi:hypothetical protein